MAQRATPLTFRGVSRLSVGRGQLLNLIETVALYDQIRSHPERDWTPRVKIFGGKAASSYHNAKLVIKLANDIARRVNSDPSVGGLLKVVFVPNYNVSVAEKIIPASELSQHISTAGTEASGTSNMKFSMNGCVLLGTLDGANVEIRDCVGHDNFFLFGALHRDRQAVRPAVMGQFVVCFDIGHDRLGRAVDRVAGREERCLDVVFAEQGDQPGNDHSVVFAARDRSGRGHAAGYEARHVVVVEGQTNDVARHGGASWYTGL